MIIAERFVGCSGGRGTADLLFIAYEVSEERHATSYGSFAREMMRDAQSFFVSGIHYFVIVECEGLHHFCKLYARNIAVGAPTTILLLQLSKLAMMSMMKSSRI